MSEHLTSAYHPQSNGLDERFNQTLQRQLLKFVEKENDWDLYLDSVLFSYRVSKQDSTKFSPFFLVYGRQARLPIEFNMKPEKDDFGKSDEEEEELDSNLDEHVEKMVSVRRKALENIKKAQERQKYYYDKKNCSSNKLYEIGKLVLLKNSKKLSRKGSKMEINWTGPYKVSEILGKGTVKLSSCDGKKELSAIYNITRLKLYHERKQNDNVTSYEAITVW